MRFANLDGRLQVPGFRGLIANGLAAFSGPTAWMLARQSILRHGAIQHVDELTTFAKIVRARQPRRILEIGTAQGGMFWLLCRLAAPDCVLISLDLPSDDRFSGGNPQTLNLPAMKCAGQTVHSILGNSHSPEMPDRVGKFLNGELLDLLFIDGDHTYAGVRSDYLMYQPLVRPGGLIAFHDIVKTPWVGCEVDRFWAELMQDHELNPRTIIGHFRSHWGGIGLVERKRLCMAAPA
jgi:predicted O-methyltransferase YrrM